MTPGLLFNGWSGGSLEPLYGARFPLAFWVLTLPPALAAFAAADDVPAYCKRHIQFATK